MSHLIERKVQDPRAPMLLNADNHIRRHTLRPAKDPYNMRPSLELWRPNRLSGETPMTLLGSPNRSAIDLSATGSAADE